MFKRSLRSLAVLGLSAALVASGGSVASATPATGTGTASNLLYSVNGGPWTADASANRGDTVTARLFYDNSSDGTLSGTSLTTAIPGGFSYVPGSTRNVLAPGSSVAFGVVGAETKAAAVADSVWSGGTLTVSPSAGFNGESDASQSGVLRNGVKRFLNLQECAYVAGALSPGTPNYFDARLVGSSGRASGTNASNVADTSAECDAGNGAYALSQSEVRAVDLLGNRYLNLQECAYVAGALSPGSPNYFDARLVGSSGRASGTNASNVADTSAECDAGNGAYALSRSEVRAVDLLGNRYLNLQECAYVAGALSPGSPNYFDARLVGSSGRASGTNASNVADTSAECDAGNGAYALSRSEVRAVDLLDSARGQGFVEFELTSDVPAPPACGATVSEPAVSSTREGTLNGSGTGTPVSSASITLNEYTVAGEDCPVEPVLPGAVNDVSATTQDVPVTIDVLANDTGVDGVTVTAGGTGPFHGSVVVNADRTLTYTPAPGYFGPDSFTYTITDADGNTSTATVDVTIAEEEDGIPLVAPGITGIIALAGLATFGLRRRLTA